MGYFPIFISDFVRRSEEMTEIAAKKLLFTYFLLKFFANAVKNRIHL